MQALFLAECSEKKIIEKREEREKRGGGGGGEGETEKLYKNSSKPKITTVYVTMEVI